MDSPDREGTRRRLYELMDDPEVPIADKQRRALSLAREYLGVENGHIQRRNDDGATDEVVASVGDDPDLLPEGTTLDRATTYCRRTVEAHSPVALSNVPEQGWADDPAYEKHGFDCYLGTTIFVDGDVYGTVCFVSRAAREAEFTSDEKALVELVARLLGRAIEAGEYERRIAATERAQQRSERKYEALLRLAPDAIFLADADTTTITDVNEKAARLTGYDGSELREMSVLDLHPPENRDRYARLFEDGLDGNPRDRFDDGSPLLIRRADGSDVPIEMSVTTVSVEGRRLVQGIVRDISARREREDELELSREFLQQTQEAVHLGGWEVDLRAGDLRWTDEVYRIHGLPVGRELTVSEALEFYHPEDRQAVEGAYRRLTTEGEPYDLEVRIVTAEGETRWVRTIGRPQYDDAGEEVVAVRGIFRDITERKERERDLRVRSQAIEESTVGITIGDASQPDIPIVYANDGFVRLTGYPKERVLGDNCRFLQGEGTDDATTAEIRAAIEADDAIRTRILNYRANGTPFWNKLTIAPVTGEDGGEVTHYVGIQEDVTARERRDRLIEVLDRVLRHNLRNDMNAVAGFADIIADRTDGEVAGMARSIEETAADLTALSEKVRGFGTAVTDAEPLGRRDVVEDVRGAVADLRHEHPDVAFGVEGSSSEEVMATEELVLALRELGDNAAKHGSPPVTYEVAAAEDGRVAVHVRDAGPGLPESEREVLRSGRETPLEHGSGLGLWMVNWIVTGLGGDVTTAGDGGTTVTIRLPPPSEEAGRERRGAALGVGREN